MSRDLNTLTSNEYYGGLNRRFERRAKLLKRLGFRYEKTEYGAVFSRKRSYRNDGCIPAATLHHADRRAWIDTLLNRGVRRGMPFVWKP